MDFANLFIDSNAGESLYYILTISLSLTAFLIALDQRFRSNNEVIAARYSVALFGVVTAWGILTAGNLYSILDANAQADVIMPPLERVVGALVILLLAWAFLAAESPKLERGSTLVMVMLLFGTILSYGVTVAEWTSIADTENFNQSSLGMLWSVISVAYLVGALVLMFTHYTYAADIPLKLLFFAVNIVGHGYAIYEMSQDSLSGNAVGSIRFTTLVGLTIVPVVMYRMVLERFREIFGEVSGFTTNQQVSGVNPLMMSPSVNPATLQDQTSAEPSEPPGAAAQRQSTWLIKILGEMLETSAPSELPVQICIAVAKTLKADIVAIAKVEDANWLDLVAGYNDIQETEITGLPLNLDEQQTLASTIELNIQTVILPTRDGAELTDLFKRLDVKETGPSGPAYFQPLTRNRKIIGMLILANPYRVSLLDDTARGQLEALAPIAARLLSISLMAQDSGGGAGEAQPSGDAIIRQEMQGVIEKSRQQISTLNEQVQTLRDALAQERAKLEKLSSLSSDDMSITQRISVLSEKQEQLNLQREELTHALQRANTLLVGATADSDAEVYQQMAEALQEERDNLLQERDRLKQDLVEVQAAQATPQTVETDPQLQQMVERLTSENEDLNKEHKKLRSAIHDAQRQLVDLGIEEGFMGFGQLVAHLTEERNRFLAEAKRMRVERDRLLDERQQYALQYRQQDQQSAQVQALETQIKRLAADRESLVSQRDMLTSERETLTKQIEEWLDIRTKLTAQMDKLRKENMSLKNGSSSGMMDTSAVHISTDPLMSNTGIVRLQKHVDDVEEERSDLEFMLRRANEDIKLLEDELGRLQGVLESGTASPEDEQQTAETIVGLAQEFRTPLTSIRGYADLLLEESLGVLGESQKQLLRRVNVNSEQLGRLIEDLVRVLAIDYGKLLLAPSKVDIHDIIDDAITVSSAQYRERAITLNIEVAHNLPSIMGDADAITQVLTRLLNNAYLASPRGAAVTIRANVFPQFGDPPEDVIAFSITDQGEGVPQAQYDRVFVRHYRAENPLITGLGDKGAGLSIAKALVEAHGGRIWLESVPQKGTTFHFTIPVDHTFAEKDILRGNVSRLIGALGAE